jgi:hypothetical protein
MDTPLSVSTTGTADHEQAGPSAGDSSGPSRSELARQMERMQQLITRSPWRASVVLLARLIILAGIGSVLRLAITLGPFAAVVTWVLLTAVLAGRWYQVSRSRPGAAAQPPGTWRPGQPPPAGIPDATLDALAPMLARVSSRRWAGAWLEIARCSGQAPHDRCYWAAAMPEAGGIRVIIGEHLAMRPAEAAFAAAHEVRHPAGWTCHLSVAANGARLAGWLVAGMAVPWPWLPAVLAGIQVATAAACWVTEVGCDLGAARSEGRAAARGFFAHRRMLNREGKDGRPAWGRHGRRLIIAVTVPAAHPPLWLRSVIISALVPARSRRA